MKKLFGGRFFMRTLLGAALLLLTVFTTVSATYAEEKKKDEPLKISGFIDLVAGIYSSHAKKDGLDSYANLYLLGLNLDGQVGQFGYHATVHITGTGANTSTSGTRSFSAYAAPIWLEEGYVFADLGIGSDSKLKFGSIYTPFGLDGDNSWYYQVHYYAGMSLDADYGTVLDMNYAFGKSLDLRVALGYYLQDDDQNGSRNAGHTDISIEGDTTNAFEERSKFVARLAPTLKFGKHSVGIGLSAMFGDIKSDTGKSKQYAYEADLDANLSFGKVGVRAFGEIIIADRNTRFLNSVNKKYTLWLAGGSLSYELGMKWLKSIDLHGNYGVINRRGNQGTTTDSDLLILGSAIGFSDNLSMTLEYVVGKNDTSKALSGNRFDDVFIIDFFYSF